MNKKITMDDIAKKVGVSKNAVSIALRGLPGVSEDMRQLILKTAADLGYQRPTSNLEFSQTNQTICIIMSANIDKGRDFFEGIVYGIENEARRNGIACNIFWQNDDLPAGIFESSFYGIICVGIFKSDYLLKLKTSNLPVILVDHYIYDLDVNTILTDNLTGGYLATRHLIDLNHPSIAFVGDVNFSPSYYDRWLGYMKALGQLQQTPNTQGIYFSSASDVIKKETLPSAFVCCSDFVAMDLYKILTKINLKIPDDVSVVGFDNSLFSEKLYPELTTLHVKRHDLGKNAVQRLLFILNTPDHEPKAVLLRPELVKRNSTKEYGS